LAVLLAGARLRLAALQVVPQSRRQAFPLVEVACGSRLLR
jgi:hypothetical protein